MTTRGKLNTNKITSFTQLKRGDVLFKYANDTTGDVITFLQAAVTYSEDEKQKIKKFEEALVSGGENVRKLSHMLIYVGNGKAIEAVGDGIQMNKLNETHNLKAKFEIFHCDNHELAKNAVEYAMLTYAAGGKYNYSALYGGIVKKIPALTLGAVKVADKVVEKGGGGAWRWIKQATVDVVDTVIVTPVKFVAGVGAKVISAVTPDGLKKLADTVIDTLGDGYNAVDDTLKGGLDLIAKQKIAYLSTAAGVAREVLTSNPSIESYHKRLTKLHEGLRQKTVPPVDFFCSELVAFSYDMACADMHKKHIVDNAPSSMVTPLDFIIDLWENDEFTYAGYLEPQSGVTGLPDIRNGLEANEYLQAGEFLVSPNGKFKLYYQTNGNLELKNEGNQTIWQTNTGTGKAWLTFMQKDGNFVVYSERTRAVAWSSDKYGPQYTHAKLKVDDDGAIRTYDHNNNVYWSSK